MKDVPSAQIPSSSGITSKYRSSLLADPGKLNKFKTIIDYILKADLIAHMKNQTKHDHGSEILSKKPSQLYIFKWIRKTLFSIARRYIDQRKKRKGRDRCTHKTVEMIYNFVSLKKHKKKTLTSSLHKLQI